MTEPEHPIPSSHFDVTLNEEYKQEHEREEMRRELLNRGREPTGSSTISSSTTSVVDERGSTHGPRKMQTIIEVNMMEAMRLTNDFDSLPFDMQSSLNMIATKISRIIAGDEQHMDHWIDISGYSELVIKERKNG